MSSMVMHILMVQLCDFDTLQTVYIEVKNIFQLANTENQFRPKNIKITVILCRLIYMEK